MPWARKVSWWLRVAGLRNHKTNLSLDRNTRYEKKRRTTENTIKGPSRPQSKANVGGSTKDPASFDNARSSRGTDTKKKLAVLGPLPDIRRSDQRSQTSPHVTLHITHYGTTLIIAHLELSSSKGTSRPLSLADVAGNPSYRVGRSRGKGCGLAYTREPVRGSELPAGQYMAHAREAESGGLCNNFNRWAESQDMRAVGVMASFNLHLRSSWVMLKSSEINTGLAAAANRREYVIREYPV
ncbi:hypothetical protein BDV93DRAFT_514195 [Ceratobasidium sp. AG-I]|nr:hypothetical protein BDV93DRAFT_514195 [Ceratobasidium sp. AG-I]